MKLEEVVGTGSMEDHGTDLSEFGDRELYYHENGKAIFKSVSKTGDFVKFDIDQKAFVVGQVSTTFAGKIKNNLFVTRRGWCDPQYRGNGLITTIMMGLFTQKDFAIMSDNLFSPDGHATWLKLCSILPITNYYVFDRNNNTLDRIDHGEMVRQLASDNEHTQFVVEHDWGKDISLVEEWKVMVYRSNGGGSLLEKYDLVGLL